MERILISSCLMGSRVRYHGGDALVTHAVLDQWAKEGRLVVICPEMAAGLPAPRPRAEIGNGAGGLTVLSGNGRVSDEHGADVTKVYVRGAQEAVAVARKHGVRVAILKDGSPSCGTSFTYDGSFSGGRVSQAGVVAAALQSAGITCYNAAQLNEASAYIAQLEAGSYGR